VEIELPTLPTDSSPTRRHRGGAIAELSEVQSEVPELSTESLDTNSLPTTSRRSASEDVPAAPEANTHVLDKVVAHVEQILATDDSSQSKVQDILNTIINDIEARDAEEKEAKKVIAEVEDAAGLEN
jgi:hypothetical protein